VSSDDNGDVQDARTVEALELLAKHMTGYLPTDERDEITLELTPASQSQLQYLLERHNPADSFFQRHGRALADLTAGTPWAIEPDGLEELCLWAENTARYQFLREENCNIFVLATPSDIHDEYARQVTRIVHAEL